MTKKNFLWSRKVDNTFLILKRIGLPIPLKEGLTTARRASFRTENRKNLSPITPMADPAKGGKAIFLLVIGLLGYWVIGLAGCGYTTRATVALSKYKTIYIRPFLNKIDITQETDAASKYKIYKPMLESDVSKAVNNKFLLDGNFKPLKKESADLTLKGELIEFQREPLRYSDNQDIEEYRINIVVNLQLWGNQENKLLWEENNFTGTATYFTTGSTAKSDASAVADAITDLAHRIVERAVEEW